ncbi:SpoIIE family protein phosphatase [Streptomyces marispadix]|uniref:PAS domain-containing SpoIIE family protein phosphatase/ATP-binding protein n=1 Tax=Streptomyces marispadix TaxID=2922868 RepID=A0ABS9SWM3_9ACTN|nr:SpoIIE family protein phosphatase [Streptomyces marispadix]MCH6160682.1 PAS domain-containing SpoIIE family protein phosphatase/ATP-binding protein [Streptomyces marispadix]
MNAWSEAETIDFRGPFDVTSAATVLLDSESVVIGWSEAAGELFGYEPREILGRPLETLIVGRASRKQPLIELLDRSVGPACRSEACVALHRDGHRMEVATTICSFSGRDGSPQIMVAAALEPLRSWEAHQAMLRGLATQSPIGLGIYDTDLRLTWINAKYQSEIDRKFHEYAGKRVNELYDGGEVISEGHPSSLEEVMRGVIDTGEPVFGILYEARPPVDPEHDHVWSCAYYQLRDADGNVIGVCEDALDITERYRAQQRLALTVRAGVRIGTTLDMITTAREIAEVVVPSFADRVTVDLVEGVLEGEEPRPQGASPSLIRVVERSGSPYADAGSEDATAAGPYRVEYEPGSPQLSSLASRKAVTVGHHPPYGGGAEDGVHSTLAVPLRARGTTMGLATFMRSGNPAPFETDELTLANELATRTALSVDNARRYTRERASALTLQRNLLPRGLPEQSAVDVAHRYLPSDIGLGVGGDWFDVIALSGTRVGLVVGDVVGHGVHAAATMGRLRTTVRALARLDLAPDELLSRLDDLVLQGAEDQEPGAVPGTDEGLGVACLYAVYDPVSRKCTAARAGHPPAASIDPEGKFQLLDIPPGPPLGVGGLPFEAMEIELPEGSLLALFTGGLVQDRDRDIDTGVAKLRDVLSDRDGTLEELCDRALNELQPDGPATDDAALLLVRTHELGADQVIGWELTAEPSSVGRARTLVLDQLSEWGLDEMAFTTELVVSELVTNAIRHAVGPVYLRLIRDRSLHCEVSDKGHTSPNLRHSATDDEGGRGLFIVAQMVQRWGTRYTTSGKTIWTEQNLV